MGVKLTARTAEVISVPPNKQEPPNSPIRAESWCGNETDWSGNIADASTTCTDMHSNQNSARTAEKTAEEVSKTPKKPKVPNSPIGTKIWCQGEENGSGNHVDRSTMCRDTPSVETNARTAENASRKVKTCQRRPRSQNLPCMLKIETEKVSRAMETHQQQWE